MQPLLEGLGHRLLVRSQQDSAGPLSGGASSGSSEPLAVLRSHPQFDALRRLVQTNPSMLQQVLAQIGQQQPELLQAINANQAAFLEMMNEPVADAPGKKSICVHEMCSKIFYII